MFGSGDPFYYDFFLRGLQKSGYHITSSAKTVVASSLLRQKARRKGGCTNTGWICGRLLDEGSKTMSNLVVVVKAGLGSGDRRD